MYDPTRTIRAGVTSVPTPFGNQRPIAKLLDDIDKAMTPPVDPVPRFAAALVLTPDVDGGDAA